MMHGREAGLVRRAKRGDIDTTRPEYRDGHASRAQRPAGDNRGLPMFSHVFLGISDFPRALAFYEPLMRALHIERRFCDPTRPWAGWQSEPGPRPLFVIGHPYDKQPT